VGVLHMEAIKLSSVAGWIVIPKYSNACVQKKKRQVAGFDDSLFPAGAVNPLDRLRSHQRSRRGRKATLHMREP